MGTAEHQVRIDLVAFDDVLIRQFGKEPDLPAVLEGTGGLVLDPLPQQPVGKGKSFLILYHPVPVRDHSQHLVVHIPEIGFVSEDWDISCGHDGLLDYLPIQAGQSQRLIGTERRFHPDSQAVPRGLTDIKHGFYISCHCSRLL